MSGGTLFTLSDGRQVDLLAPTSADIDLLAAAGRLAKINRYNGGTPIPYSVAEHLCRGTSAILAGIGVPEMLEGERERLAAYFLLHDFHEAFLGDDVTPKKRTVAAVAGQFGLLAPVVLDAFDAVALRFDIAIHAAARLAWPMPADVAFVVGQMDRRMLATEWRDLMACPPPFAIEPGCEAIRPSERWPSRIEPWDWRVAARVLRDHCRALLPAFMPEPDRPSRDTGRGSRA